MEDFADVTYSMCALKIGQVERLENDPNNIVSTQVIWTKLTDWKTAETKWDATYVPQDVPPSLTDHYIQSFLYGIVHAKTTLKYISGTGIDK